MSGGHFDYLEYNIEIIKDSIESNLAKMGKAKTEEECHWHSEGFLEQYPEERMHEDYSEEVKESFREAIKILEKAYVYSKAIDKLLSGDYGEDTFLEVLKEKLRC